MSFEKQFKEGDQIIDTYGKIHTFIRYDKSICGGCGTECPGFMVTNSKSKYGEGCGWNRGKTTYKLYTPIPKFKPFNLRNM